MEKDAAVPVEKLQMKISKYNKRKENSDCRLIGEHVPVNEAREIWPDRFDAAKARDAGAAFLQVRRHNTIAPVDDQIYHLGDCCHIKVFFNTSCKLEEEDYAEAKRALVDGLESSQIREFGLPVRPSFCRPVKKTARALGKALFNAELGKPIGQIIIICGRNKILASTLETSPWKVPLKRIRGQKWRNGWVL